MNTLIGLDRLEQIMNDIQTQFHVEYPLAIDKGGTGVNTIEALRDEVTGMIDPFVHPAISTTPDRDTEPNLIISNITSSIVDKITWLYDTTIIGYDNASDTTDVEYSTLIGHRIMKKCSSYGDVVIGNEAGMNMLNSTDNVIIGDYAAKMTEQTETDTADRIAELSVIIGNAAFMNGTKAVDAVILGETACYNTKTVTDSNIIGEAGVYSANILHSDAVGCGVGMNADIVNNSVLIGKYAAKMPSTKQTDTSGNEIDRKIENAIVIGANAAPAAGGLSNIVAIGTNALNTATTITQAVVVGPNCGDTASEVSESVLIGANAFGNGPSTSAMKGSVTLGQYACYNTKQSLLSVIIGKWACYGVSTVEDSVSIGSNASKSANKVTGSVTIGHNALQGNIDNLSYSTTIGYQAGYNITRISNSVINGAYAAGKQLSVDRSIISGYYAGYGGNTSDYTTRTITLSTIIGTTAGYVIDSANSCTFIGNQAAYKCITALETDCIGHRSAYSATTLTKSHLIGAWTGWTATSITDSAIIGISAGYYADTITGSLCFGREAGRMSNTGSGRVIDKSTVLGPYAASTVPTKLTNCTFIGYLAGNTIATPTNSTAIGYQASVTGDNQVQLGNSSTTTYVYGSVQNRSDRRDKANITDLEYDYVKFIDSLRPRNFQWDMREDYLPEPDIGTFDPEHPDEAQPVSDETPLSLDQITPDGTHMRSRRHNGFIAQEVKEAADELGFDFAGYQDHSVNGGRDVLSLGYEEFIAPMVAYMQELRQDVRALQEQNQRLQDRVTALENK